MTKFENKFIRGLHNLKPAKTSCVATIGSFDGVHLGHRAILKQLIDKATELQLPSVVMIFEPQPQEFFSGEQAPARLMRLREKVEEFVKIGIDKVFCLQFNRSLRSLSAIDFIEKILIYGLKVQCLVVGDDFRFGHDRSGNYKLLQNLDIKIILMSSIPVLWSIRENELVAPGYVQHLRHQNSILQKDCWVSLSR